MNKRRRYIAKRKRNIKRWTRELNFSRFHGNNPARRQRLMRQLKAIAGDLIALWALQLVVWHGPKPSPSEMARVLSEKESSVNFTHVRPALPEGPKVVVVDSVATVIPRPPEPLRLDGTPRWLPPAVYGETYVHHEANVHHSQADRPYSHRR